MLDSVEAGSLYPNVVQNVCRLREKLHALSKLKEKSPAQALLSVLLLSQYVWSGRTTSPAIFASKACIFFIHIWSTAPLLHGNIKDCVDLFHKISIFWNDFPTNPRQIVCRNKLVSKHQWFSKHAMPCFPWSKLNIQTAMSTDVSN